VSRERREIEKEEKKDRPTSREILRESESS
jgi:hypothetical protein